VPRDVRRAGARMSRDGALIAALTKRLEWPLQSMHVDELLVAACG